mgnify:FL=1
MNWSAGVTSMVEGTLSSTGAKSLIDLIRKFDHVLAVLAMDSGLTVDIDAEFIDAKIVARKAARDNKDFASGDAIRDELVALGVELIDTPEGTKWKIK